MVPFVIFISTGEVRAGLTGKRMTIVIAPVSASALFFQHSLWAIIDRAFMLHTIMQFLFIIHWRMFDVAPKFWLVCDIDIKRSMRKFNTITAYLIPSLFRIKADRIFIGSNCTVTGNTVFCHVEFIACAYQLRAKRLSHFSFRIPICLMIIFYYESRIIYGNIPKARSISYKC